MSTRTLRCFGGPRDGDMLAVRREQMRVLVALPPDDYRIEAEYVPLRTSVYRVERFGFKECAHARDPEVCSIIDGCRAPWVGAALIYEGYPSIHVEQQLTAIYGITALMHTPKHRPVLDHTDKETA